MAAVSYGAVYHGKQPRGGWGEGDSMISLRNVRGSWSTIRDIPSRGEAQVPQVRVLTPWSRSHHVVLDETAILVKYGSSLLLWSIAKLFVHPMLPRRRDAPPPVEELLIIRHGADEDHILSRRNIDGSLLSHLDVLPTASFSGHLTDLASQVGEVVGLTVIPYEVIREGKTNVEYEN